MRPDHLFSVLLLVVWVPGVPAPELKERGTFKGFTFPVDRAELSPDCKVVVVGGHEGELKLWSVATGKEIASLPGNTNSLSSLAFSADGKRLTSGGQNSVQVWDVNAHKAIASFKGLPYAASAVALNRDGTRLAAVGRGQGKLWDVASGKELASFRHRDPLNGGLGTDFSRDLTTLAIRNYQEIDLWVTATGKEKVILSEYRGAVGCMVWSDDDKTLIASSTRYEGKDYKWKGDVKLWDVASGKERATLPGPFGRVQAMALSPDGKTLALLNSDDLYAEIDLMLVDMDTGRQHVIRALPRCSFLSLRFNPEGKLLVTGASGDTLRLWEVVPPNRGRKP